MPYLLDAGVLIRAKRDHYRFGTFPCFWDWILAQHAAGNVFSVQSVQQEIIRGGDDLTTWIAAIPNAFLPPDQATANAAQRLSVWAADPAQGFKQAAVTDFFAAADYWLISHASAHGFTVVTQEFPEPQRRNKIKVPDACRGFGVPCLNTFDMLGNENARFG